jgi:hypothetical protein
MPGVVCVLKFGCEKREKRETGWEEEGGRREEEEGVGGGRRERACATGRGSFQAVEPAPP